MQLPLFPVTDGQKHDQKDLSRATFSHEQVCPEDSRIDLENTYESILEETDRFDRKLVSYQGNKGEMVHGWIKYREGFSAELVAALLDEFGINPGDTILEPFSGSGTTLLVAKSRGIDAVGIEILPNCYLSWEAKSYLYRYDIDELRALYEQIATTEPPETDTPFPHIVITESAFPADAEKDLMAYTEWLDTLNLSPQARTLLRLILSGILEEVSYTRKDGQYLRWDSRAEKVIQRNKRRTAAGKKTIKGVDKGTLPSMKMAILGALGTIIDDIASLQEDPAKPGDQRLLRGSALSVLPSLDENRFDAVITSPPYCNRYDYTRTYALELAYLGIGEEGIRALRQSQLSCTVENRSKIDLLRGIYSKQGREDRFSEIFDIVESHPALQEINQALQMRWDRGEINNRGILSMVDGYFTEMAFVFAELYRTCKAGAQVAFVNDNVRYGGEVIPVDLLCTSLAEEFGFTPEKVYVLPQRKGNSSQQMGRFGREALRKSITIWKK